MSVRDELAQRGFAVVRNCFDPGDLAVVRADCDALRRAGAGSGEELVSGLTFEDPRMARLRARVLELVAQATAERALLPVNVGNYISSREVRYGFHCDYGILGPSPGGFKVWVPLVKPDAAEAGMTFVRKDLFRAREPDIAARVGDRGAAGIKDSGEVVVIGATVDRRQLARPIDDLCETPSVAVGDAVLFRPQDTFHRSQVAAAPEGPERLAWAFPVRIADEPIRRADVFLGRKKREFIGRERAAMALACFWYHRRDHITVEELDRFERQLAGRRLVPRALYAAAWAVEPRVWPRGPE